MADLRNKKKRGLKRRDLTSYTAARSWFRCDIYPEKHEGQEHEIAEHFWIASTVGNRLSEREIIDKHSSRFPWHEVIDYSIGKVWHYQRDKYGHRV